MATSHASVFLSYPLQIEHMRALRDLIRVPVLNRYGNRPLQDIIPLVFVMYAIYKETDLHFEDGRLAVPGTEGFGRGPILDELYWETPLCRGGKCREAEELYNAMVPLVDDELKTHLPAFLEYYILKRPGVVYTPLFPIYLEKDLSRILSAHYARCIYDCGSGLGLVTRAYDGWESYTAFDLGHCNMLVADLLRDLSGKREAFRASFDYLESEHQIGRYDTVVVNLLGRRMNERDPSVELERLFGRLFSLGRCRLAILMLDYRFCVDAQYEVIRKTICERGVLEEVVEVESECFSSGVGRSAVLVLNQEGTEGKPVMFRHVERREFIRREVSVSIGNLERCRFILDSSFYSEKTWRYPDGFPNAPDSETIPFGNLVQELARADLLGYNRYSKCELCLTEEDYARMPPDVFSPRIPHKCPPVPERRRRYLTGSVVSILFMEEAPFYKVCRIESKAGYALPWNTISFRPSDSVDISYFICVLFMSERLKNALRGIRNMLFESSLRPGSESLPEEYIADILATYPVEIIPDKSKQAEFAREIARRGESVAKTETEYGVVIVGTPLTDAERGELQSWKIRTVSETEGVDSLDNILKTDAEGLKEIDAVFFDVNVESGGNAVGHYGLFRAMNVSGSVPLIVFSDEDLDSFNAQERSFYELARSNRKGDRFVFKKDGESLKNAVRDLRDSLDAQMSPDRAVKAKYSAELELARRLDPSGDMAVTLVNAMRGEFEDFEDPKEIADRIGLLRIGAETIFNDAKERGLLPPLTFVGAMQQLLADGEYFDNGSRKYYRLTEEVMPATLSCAFEYFVTIVNGGHHAKQKGKLDVIGYISGVAKSPNVYRSCVFILMDLLRWYGGLKADAPLYEETAPFLEDDIIRKVKDGNRDYYYIGRVHLGYSQGLTDGIPGRVLTLRSVSLEKFPAPPGVENEIRFFSTDYKIGR